MWEEENLQVNALSTFRIKKELHMMTEIKKIRFQGSNRCKLLNQKSVG